MRAIAAKNKAPAPVQITAEQILRESRERQNDAQIRPPKQIITDYTELSDYRLRRRKEFENQIRGEKDSSHRAWVRYADWEESQSDYARARSVWERALGIHHRNHTLWLKYAEFEMRNRFVNSARNVLERAVRILPRVDQIWLKYIHMEEMLGNVAGAREIFERWMDWSPDQQAWLCFVKFELRYDEIERVRSVYERFVNRFYCKEVELAKRKEETEEAVRFRYEDDVRKSPLKYDSWFDYIRLEESLKNNKDRIREIYERAIVNVPLAEEKRYWKRYIYLWIGYALYEEIEAEDVERTRAVYRECLEVTPHSKFSFAKVWLLAARFEIRQLNLTGARRILGNAIGRAPSHKVFKGYIEIELELGNIDRCRKLYERYLEWSPENCYGWSKYAELERSLAEKERARAIFELAVSQASLDMPEMLWKAYIDFEISLGEVERARALYERLLNRTKHYKVWVSFAKFEAYAAAEQEEDSVGIQHVRAVFDIANTYYKESKPELKEERAALLEDWLNMETSFGMLGDVSDVQEKLPKKLKKRKRNTREDGSTEYEEYMEFLFPEESQTANRKIIEAAYKWKKQQMAGF